MSVVVRVLGVASTGELFDAPTWLSFYDVEAFDGRGDAGLTGNVDEALRFTDAAAAMRVWRSQSTVRPLRPDGQPNRPLTAFHVSIEPVAE